MKHSYTHIAEKKTGEYSKMTYYSQMRPGGRGMFPCLRFLSTLLARGGHSHDVTAGACCAENNACVSTTKNERI